MRMRCTISKATSAEASVAALRISSENNEYSATIVIKIWNPMLSKTRFIVFQQAPIFFYVDGFMQFFRNMSAVAYDRGRVTFLSYIQMDSLWLFYSLLYSAIWNTHYSLLYIQKLCLFMKFFPFNLCNLSISKISAFFKSKTKTIGF